MTDSILTGTKRILGIDEDYTAFDHDIITHINSVFSTLEQLGIGPEGGFSIEDATATWDTFLGDNKRYNSIRTYVYLRVRLIFDPPATSFHLQAVQEQIAELEFRLSVTRESTAWVDPSGFLTEDDLREGIPEAFTWDGTTYQPQDLLTDLTRQKWFTGPVDPVSVGAYMAPYDVWINSAA